MSGAACTFPAVPWSGSKNRLDMLRTVAWASAMQIVWRPVSSATQNSPRWSLGSAKKHFGEAQGKSSVAVATHDICDKRAVAVYNEHSSIKILMSNLTQYLQKLPVSSCITSNPFPGAIKSAYECDLRRRHSSDCSSMECRATVARAALTQLGGSRAVAAYEKHSSIKSLMSNLIQYLQKFLVSSCITSNPFSDAVRSAYECNLWRRHCSSCSSGQRSVAEIRAVTTQLSDNRAVAACKEHSSILVLMSIVQYLQKFLVSSCITSNPFSDAIKSAYECNSRHSHSSSCSSLVLIRRGVSTA
jgi:hypothetical protein